MFPWRIIAISFVASLSFVALFFCSTGLIPKVGYWYSSDPTFIYQTKAILNGSFALDDIVPIDYDYVLYNGKVQQVWGLGVPLLKIPFLFFPDRIILLLYFFLAYSLFFFAIYHISKNIYINIVLLFTFTFFTPLFSLARTRFIVYEETIFYGVLAIIFLLSCLILSKKLNYYSTLLITFLSGAVGLIRPTLLIYGAVIFVLLFWKHVFVYSKKQKFILTLAFLIGVGLVGITNTMRFGSSFEFGHRLNVDNDTVNNHLLKFGSDDISPNLFERSGELIGALFFTHPQQTNIYGKDIIQMQTEQIRFRNFYSHTYNVFYFILLLVSIVYMFRDRNFLLIFGVSSFILLFVFYLYSPAIISRYLVDFVPAFIALMIYWAFKWKADNNHEKVISYLTVVLFLSVTLLGTSKEFFKAEHSSRTFDKFQMQTEAYEDPQTKVFGAGWNARTGEASSTVLIFKKDIKEKLTVYIDDIEKCKFINREQTMLKIGNEYIKPNSLFKFDIPEKFQDGNKWPIFIKLYNLTDVSKSETGCKIIDIN